MSHRPVLVVLFHVCNLNPVYPSALGISVDILLPKASYVHLSSRIGNPLALAGGGKSALLNESIAFFFEKTLDIFSKMWFNSCITLADICSITAPFPVTGGDPGNVSAYPLQRG